MALRVGSERSMVDHPQEIGKPALISRTPTFRWKGPVVPIDKFSGHTIPHGYECTVAQRQQRARARAQHVS